MHYSEVDILHVRYKSVNFRNLSTLGGTCARCCNASHFMIACLRVWGLGFGVWGLRFRVHGWELRVRV